jgi:hypothetical protein
MAVDATVEARRACCGSAGGRGGCLAGAAVDTPHRRQKDAKVGHSFPHRGQGRMSISRSPYDPCRF